MSAKPLISLAKEAEMHLLSKKEELQEKNELVQLKSALRGP